MSAVVLFYANDRETIHSETPTEYPGQIRLVRRRGATTTTRRVDTTREAVEVYVGWVTEAEQERAK